MFHLSHIAGGANETRLGLGERLSAHPRRGFGFTVFASSGLLDGRAAFGAALVAMIAASGWVQARAEVPHNVVAAIVIGAVFVVVVGVLVSRCVIGIRDDTGNGMNPIDACRALLLDDIRRARKTVTAWRTAFSRTAHLQQARLTLDPFQLEPADLDGLDHLSGSWLHKSARSEIAQLVAALSATEADPDNPGRDRALACYDAAALLADERNDRLDLLGAVVLAREGQTALAHRDPLPLPVCQVNPLHGPAVRRPPPRRRLRPDKPHAVCAGCGRCSMLERDMRALLVAGVPYYRAPGFWASVGFGALDPELPARVLEYMRVE